MKLKSVLFPLFLLISSSAFSEKISSIDIFGLNTISRGTVLEYIPFEVGDEINDQTLLSIDKSLKKTGFFSNISLKIIKNILEITLTENPTIKFLEFKNYKNDLVLNDQMIDSIKINSGLGVGKIYSKDQLNKLINQLLSLYKTNGFYKTKISLKVVNDSQNRIGIELLFNEGERALIKSFNVKGSSYFDEADLVDLFEIGEPDLYLLNFFTEKDHFSSTKFDAGIEILKNKYFNIGFLDLKILSKDVKYNEEDDSLNILISIDEGTQYKVGNINFIGNLSKKERNYLRSLVKINDGEFLNRKDLFKGIKSISDFYQNRGYAFTTISSDIKRTETISSLDIDIQIDNNIKAYIDRIEIYGNTRTQDNVIRRKFTILEGQIYSKQQIENSINQLKALGYFSDVNYKVERKSATSDKVQLTINVTETKTGEISIGMSHSNATGASLNAGITQENILGTGNTFNANFSNSDAVKETSFYFKNPYFNNKGHSISYGIFDKQIDAANLDASDYSISELGFIFGYGFPLSESSLIFGETKFSSSDLTCGSNLKNIYEIQQCSKTSNTDTILSLSYKNNTLNDFYFPTDGNQTLLSSSISLPFSDNKYFQIESIFKKYSPILTEKTFKFSTRLKFASGYGNDNLPFYKRYYEGGSSSVRGFDFNSLGTKYSDGKPKGGEVSLVSSVGVASNLDFIGIDNPNMRGILFTDAGTVSEKFSDFSISDIRSSVGVQFSWLTPIGPLGFNFATPIIKKTNDSTKTFSFELGSKF